MKCEYFLNAMKRSNLKPLAVDVGYFMLGLLLISSFDATLVELTGFVVAAIGGLPLFRRLGAKACCLRNALEASRSGEFPEACY